MGSMRSIAQPSTRAAHSTVRTSGAPGSIMAKEKDKLGRRGEQLVAGLLRLKLYRVRARNYRTRLGELDIVAERGGCLAFVEVKTRRNENYGHPGLAVDWRKRRKLFKMAKMYLAEHGLFDRDCRFDVALVDFSRGVLLPRIQHIRNAFSVGGVAEPWESYVNKNES